MGKPEDFPNWLVDIAGRVEELVAEPRVFEHFRRRLRDWHAEHRSHGPRTPVNRRGNIQQHNPVEFMPRDRPSLTAKYAALAAVHDAVGRNVKRIDLWGINRRHRADGFAKDIAGMPYTALCALVCDLQEADRERIENALQAVECDCRRESLSEKHQREHVQSVLESKLGQHDGERRMEAATRQSDTAPVEATPEHNPGQLQRLLRDLRADFDRLRQREQTVKARLVHKATNAEADGVRGYPTWLEDSSIRRKLGAGFRNGRQNRDAMGNPKFVAEPVMDADGQPIVNSVGEGFDITLPAIRTVWLVGDAKAVGQLCALAERGGRLARACRCSTLRMVSDWQFTIPEAVWWALVFELAWSGRHPALTATRQLWLTDEKGGGRATASRPAATAGAAEVPAWWGRRDHTRGLAEAAARCLHERD